MQNYLGFLIVICVTGCAAAFVPVTDDPHDKLRWAATLVGVDRPLPAEELIQEAIAIFETANDEVGLADGYQTYGLFLISKAVGGWRKWYAANGFRDQTATYDNRFEKAIQYSERAAAIYTRHGRHDGLTYAYLNIGLTYDYLGNRLAACHAFERSVQSSREVARYQPEIRMNLPPRNSSYEGLYKQRCGLKEKE